MGKVAYRYKEYIVVKDDCKGGHVIINTLGRYENHGHLKYLETCKKLLKMMDRNIVPNSDYLRGTVLRISLDKKYKSMVLNKIEKDRQKPKYTNINKGVMK